MSNVEIIVVSSISGVFSLLLTLLGLFVWNGFGNLRELYARLIKDFEDKSTPKQLEKAIVVAEGSRDRIDTALLEMGKFKEGVHAEIQRFYAIMRRNEKALADVQLTTHEDGKPKQEFPDEMPASSVETAEEDGAQISKAELRKRARAAGL